MAAALAESSHAPGIAQAICLSRPIFVNLHNQERAVERHVSAHPYQISLQEATFFKEGGCIRFCADLLMS